MVDLIGKIFRFLYPEANYLIEHGYDDICNPNVEFFKRHSNLNDSVSTNSHHDCENPVAYYNMKIDIKLLNEKKEELAKLEEEVLEIINAISESKELNECIANMYNDISNLDAQEIFRYHRDLFEKGYIDSTNKGNEKLLKKSELIEELVSSISDFSTEAITPKVIEIDEEVLLNIREIEKAQRKKGVKPEKKMPPFHAKKYMQMINLIHSHPHIKRNMVEDLVIADFAGNLTEKLKQRLTGIHPTISRPMKNPNTGAWHYSLDKTDGFISLLYLHLIDYCTEMFEEIGWITRCSWCGQYINPDNRQRAHLRNKKSIYCKPITNGYLVHSCQEQARIHKQSVKRSMEKKG